MVPSIAAGVRKEFTELDFAILDDLGWQVVPKLDGDFNHDGVVDAADYVVWRKNPNGTQAQYVVWHEHFGQPLGSGAGASLNANVPEPATLVLLMFAAAGRCLWRRRA